MKYQFTPALSMNDFGATSSDASSISSCGGSNDYAAVVSAAHMVSENAIMVFGRRGCCMCYVLQRLLLGLGVNPAIYDVDEEDEVSVTDQLSGVISCTEDNSAQLPLFPAVFIGGKLFGGLDDVMAAHISGDLVPLLIKAGALWL
ncbi:unnamed protein product [Cuscuta epithymum]|uniref:Glutaredoxin domain-containing protein n=1 Tax=Cuscuta epithymum TaxID=186058 RepID=A0AAV0F4F1_9ASTE|nr:unnamed protein product [Cuscuta epithymum]